jgi:hypothetical protein
MVLAVERCRNDRNQKLGGRNYDEGKREKEKVFTAKKLVIAYRSIVSVCLALVKVRSRRHWIAFSFVLHQEVFSSCRFMPYSGDSRDGEVMMVIIVMMR